MMLQYFRSLLLSNACVSCSEDRFIKHLYVFSVKRKNTNEKKTQIPLYDVDEYEIKRKIGYAPLTQNVMEKKDAEKENEKWKRRKRMVYVWGPFYHRTTCTQNACSASSVYGEWYTLNAILTHFNGRFLSFIKRTKYKMHSL